MAFAKKTWKKRLSENPTRRQLTYTDGTTAIVDVARLEGAISQEGDAFSDTNMNDLEQRVANAFDECFQSVSSGKALVASAITGKGVTTASDATFETMAANIAKISTGGDAEYGLYFCTKYTPVQYAKFKITKYNSKQFSTTDNYTFTVQEAGTYEFNIAGSITGTPYLRVTNSAGTVLKTQYLLEKNGVPFTVSLSKGDTIAFWQNETNSYAGMLCAVVAKA